MMPSNYEKLDRPTGPSIDTLAVPEKSAMTHVSAASTPCSDRGNPFDTDIEAMVPTATKATDNCSNKVTPQVSKSDCQVWPGKDHWKQKAKMAKKERRCTCMAGLSGPKRMAVKILVVILVVGIAVGVGFGVSKPLGAHIWGDKKDN